MADEPRVPLWARPLEEPECPDGWRIGPPDFVGVGAQRSGTTWWFRGAIRPHPGFQRPFKPLKEVHYFDRYWNEAAPSDFGERYARLFPRPPGAITGEWTPRYMCDPWAIRMLAEAAPDARILIMLRDPVERYHSGLEREARLYAQAGTFANIAIVGDAIYRSMYHRQVERVLVLQYERCLDDPLPEMRRTQEFLGLEPLEALPEKLGGPRPSRGSRVGLEERMRADLVDLLAEDVERLAALCPELDLGLWPNFAGER